jgi:hypothetical protein
VPHLLLLHLLLQYIDQALQLPAMTQEDMTRRDAFCRKKLRQILSTVLGHQ